MISDIRQIRDLSTSELEAVAGGIYVDPKKSRGPIIIEFPIPPPLPIK